MRISPVPRRSASSGWSPTRSPAIRRLREAIAPVGNVKVAEESHGEGVYEAVLSALMED